MPKAAAADYQHAPLVAGDKITLGSLIIKAIETPGHTPEHMSFVVSDTSRGVEPWLVFSGDALFVGDVGRPDLFGSELASELAGKLFDTIHHQFGSLPDFVELYPTHGEGSLCGKKLSGKRWSTIGYEKKFNHAFGPNNVDDFKEAILTGMPPAPAYFSRSSNINRLGPKILEDIPQVRKIPAQEANQLLNDDHILLDVRTHVPFGGAHIPGAYNIRHSPTLSTWSGWILPYDRPILLLLDHEDQCDEVVLQLHRVGFERITGHIHGGMQGWIDAGLPFCRLPQLSIHEVNEMLSTGKSVKVVDVRTPAEYNQGHISGAVNIHAGEIENACHYLKKEASIATVCGEGNRSSIAASILQRMGFKDIYNISGGMNAWVNAGYKITSEG